MMESELRSLFFNDFDEKELEVLSPLLEAFHASASQILFEQGQPTAYLYLIVSGRVAVRYKPYDGPEITLTHLHRGDVCGWSAVIGNRLYTSTVVAATDLETLRASHSQLKQLVREHPELGLKVLEKLAEAVTPRWKNAREQIRSLIDSNAQ